MGVIEIVVILGAILVSLVWVGVYSAGTHIAAFERELFEVLDGYGQGAGK